MKTHTLCLPLLACTMLCCSSSPVIPEGVKLERDCPEVSVADFSFDAERPVEEVVLRAGDQVRLQVYARGATLVADASATFVVPSRGLVAYPYLGELQVRGMTLGELRRLVREKLAGRVVQQPLVKADIVDFAPRSVTLEGSFAAPGKYGLDPLKQRSLVLEVLEHGRGLNYNALRHELVLRRHEKFRLVQRKLNWCELVKPGAAPVILQPDDHLIVRTVAPLRITGAVAKPILEMAYPSSPIKVYALVNAAGGLGKFADSWIEIHRQKPDGKWAVLLVDYADIDKNPFSQHNLTLLPGDRVLVREGY